MDRVPPPPAGRREQRDSREGREGNAPPPLPQGRRSAATLESVVPGDDTNLLAVRFHLHNGEKLTLGVAPHHRFGQCKEAIWNRKNFHPMELPDYIFRLANGEIFFDDQDEFAHFLSYLPIFREHPIAQSRALVECILIPRAAIASHTERETRVPTIWGLTHAKGSLQLKKDSMISSWKQRYAVIQEHTLFLFENEDVYQALQPASEVYALGSVTATRLETNDRQHWQFEVNMSKLGQKNLIFGASSPDEMWSWISIINMIHMRRTKLIVVSVTEELESRGLQSQGIFRVSGSKSSVDALMAEYDHDQYPNLSEVRDEHSLTGLFKKCIRELPEPLLTWDCYEPLLQLQMTDPTNTQNRIKHVRYIIDQMAPSNQGLLEYLMIFAQKVAAYSSTNLMTYKNLAIVFAPNILRPRIETMETTMNHSTPVLEIVQFIMENYSSIWNPEGGVIKSKELLRMTSDPTPRGAPPPPSRQNFSTLRAPPPLGRQLNEEDEGQPSSPQSRGPLGPAPALPTRHHGNGGPRIDDTPPLPSGRYMARTSTSSDEPPPLPAGRHRAESRMDDVSRNTSNSRTSDDTPPPLPSGRYPGRPSDDTPPLPSSRYPGRPSNETLRSRVAIEDRPSLNAIPPRVAQPVPIKRLKSEGDEPAEDGERIASPLASPSTGKFSFDLNTASPSPSPPIDARSFQHSILDLQSSYLSSLATIESELIQRRTKMDHVFGALVDRCAGDGAVEKAARSTLIKMNSLLTSITSDTTQLMSHWDELITLIDTFTPATTPNQTPRDANDKYNKINDISRDANDKYNKMNDISRDGNAKNNHKNDTNGSGKYTKENTNTKDPTNGHIKEKEKQETNHKEKEKEKESKGKLNGLSKFFSKSSNKEKDPSKDTLEKPISPRATSPVQKFTPPNKKSPLTSTLTSTSPTSTSTSTSTSTLTSTSTSSSTTSSTRPITNNPFILAAQRDRTESTATGSISPRLSPFTPEIEEPSTGGLSAVRSMASRIFNKGSSSSPSSPKSSPTPASLVMSSAPSRAPLDESSRTEPPTRQPPPNPIRAMGALAGVSIRPPPTPVSPRILASTSTFQPPSTLSQYAPPPSTAPPPRPRFASSEEPVEPKTPREETVAATPPTTTTIRGPPPSTPPPKPPQAAPLPPDGLYRVLAQYDHTGDAEDGEITIKKGDILVMLDDSDESGWWMARKADGTEGLIPSNFCLRI